MPAAPIGTDPREAADRLAAGQLVALPTETVYGLGANALDPAAVARIFTAKNRPSFDPLIIHQSSVARIFAYADGVGELATTLADAFWPGPLTLVVHKHERVPDLVTSGLDTVALRVPALERCREVLEYVDFPVAAPSANPFGYVSPVTARHVADQLGDRVDYILDGGRCVVGLESTIVRVTDETPLLLRRGGTPAEAIEAVLGRSLPAQTHSSSRPAAPGMLSRHYSPGVRLTLLDPDAPTPEVSGRERYVQLPRELDRAAHELFTVLRSLDPAHLDHAYVRLVPEIGLGRAINDRLRRAAAR